MSEESWKGQFGTRVGSLFLDSPECRLPLTIFGCIQQGHSHFEYNLGNQDAIAISVGNEWMMGVVSDGCSTGDSKSYDEFSRNDVGSKLLGQIIVAELEKILSRYKRRTPTPLVLLNELEKRCLSKMRRISELATYSKNEQNRFLYNYMTATLLIVVAFRTKYYVFTCGDGIVRLNGRVIPLTSESGNYLNGNLIEETDEDRFKLKLLSSGQVQELDSLVLMSDGFDVLMKHPDIWDDLDSFESVMDKTAGFVDCLSEFRQELLEPLYAKLKPWDYWPEDDASFLIIKRIDDD